MLLADLILMAVAVAVKYEIDPDMFTRLIWAESRFDPAAVSSTGCVGLCQISLTAWPLDTWMVRVPPDDPFDPRANMEQGAHILKFCMYRYSNLPFDTPHDLEPIVVAAYTLGHGAVDRIFKEHGISWEQELERKIELYVDFVARDEPYAGWGEWNWRDALDKELRDDAGTNGIYRRSGGVAGLGGGCADHVYRGAVCGIQGGAEPVLRGRAMRLTKDELCLLNWTDGTCGYCDVVELDAEDQAAFAKLMIAVRKEAPQLLVPKPKAAALTAEMMVDAILDASSGIGDMNDPEVLQNYISLVREDLDMLRKIVREKIND